jgi:two-component system cell cycle sensor histidine kinase/response regulator CckA
MGRGFGWHVTCPRPPPPVSSAEPDHEPKTQASERVLKNARDPYRTVFDQSPLPMLLCDVGTLQVLAANQLAAKLHGQSPEQLIGVSLFELRRVSDLTGVMLKRAVGREIALGFGYHCRKDGSTFPVQLSVHPSELDGRPAWLCVMKSLEETLAPREDDQQRRVLEAIGRLAGGAAHDINNLLSVILSFGSLAASQLSEASPAQSDLAEIRGAAERASALTKQLLNLSRKGPRQPKPTQLNELILRLEKLLRRLVDEQLSLELKLDPSLDRVLVDPCQVERLLVQLVSEARGAAAPGQSLLIETRNVDLDVADGQARHVMLRVTDSGSSLSPEVAARVFEPLVEDGWRGDRGSGLTSLVEAAGTAWLESEPGSGARFVACFPSLAGQASEPAAARRAVREETVLVVQDNPHLRKTLKTYFAREGYRVLEADSSIEALRLAETTRVDLMLTDYALTDGSGNELSQAVRKRLPGLKVLIAVSHPEQRAAILENDRTLSITKPFDLQQFGQLIHRLLHG